MSTDYFQFIRDRELTSSDQIKAEKKPEKSSKILYAGTGTKHWVENTQPGVVTQIVGYPKPR